MLTVLDKQREKLKNSIQAKKAVNLRLSKANLTGNDMFLLTRAQINQIEKAKQQNKGATLKLSGKQTKDKCKTRGWIGLLLSLVSIIAVTFNVKSVLPGIASGLISVSIEKAIAGSGVSGKAEKDWIFIQTDGKNCLERIL